jgi:hypothetical protein
MDATPTISETRRILLLIEGGEPPSDEQLSRALDELVLVYHHCPPGDPTGPEADPPRDSFRIPYAVMGAHFPDYGYYASADPTKVLDEEPCVGDAIDDLIEIVRDLREVSWRFDALGPDDAHWHLRFLFRINWGGHLRSLSHYLHVKQFG